MRHHHCGQKVLPAIVHPTKCCVNHTFENIVVPEIFPTHTTNVHNTNYEHVQFFPHTQSQVNEASNTVTNGGPMVPMGMGPMGMGPMGMGPMGMNPQVGGMTTPPMGMNPGCCGPRQRRPF